MEDEQRSERRRRSRDRDFESDRDSYRRRDRSRSRERSHDHRRRYRDEHDDRDRHRGRLSDDDEDSYRGRGRDRDRDDRPRRSRPSAPVVFLEKVPEKALQSDITHQLGKYAEKIRDIRVFRRGDKWDNPYKSAVIEFYERADASRWLSENKDNFSLLSEPVTVEGPQDREEQSTRVSGDWICFKCHKLNFSRRTHCITCDFSRRESERESAREDPSDRRGAPPANVLIVRGLELQTAEIDVVDAIATVSPGLRMKDVRVIRDKGSNLSRGFCFLELNTVEEATELLEKLTSKREPFLVSGKRASVDFARPSGSWSSNKNPANSVASAAIAQAQWSHADTGAGGLDPTQSTTQQASQQAATGTDSTTQDNGIPSSYSFDATSGFYYDSNTGLYYDPKTQYHYNSQTGQYCYYDPNQLKYIPVDSEGNPASEAATSTGADAGGGKKKKDSTASSLVSAGSVNAKKLAKNMERWAKSVNAAKSAQKQQMNMLIQQEKLETTPISTAGKPSGLGGIPSVGIAVGTTVPQVSERKSGGDNLAAPPPKHTLPPGADTNPTHTDWDQLACLLCKRKFPSKDVLVKHQQFSDLHKQNLLKWKNPQGATAEQPKYRDRAQERRELVGTQPIVPEWKRKVDREMAQGPTIPYEQPTVHGLKEDNIGNKMLSAMGWTDGQGLGKSNQGIVEPIKAEIRQGSAGLGSRGSTYGYGVGDDYRSNVRAMTQARYNETL